MKIICDNSYFLLGANKLIEDYFSHDDFKNVQKVIIISSTKISDVFSFIYINNIDHRCSDTIIYTYHELFDFLRDIVDTPIYNINNLIKSNSYHNHHHICRVRNAHSKLFLPRRQKSFLLMFLRGLNGKDIADILEVSVKTVSSYKKYLMNRLYVCNDTELFYKGILLSIK